MTDLAELKKQIRALSKEDRKAVCKVPKADRAPRKPNVYSIFFEKFSGKHKGEFKDQKEMMKACGVAWKAHKGKK